jgi:hypothetical protein
MAATLQKHFLGVDKHQRAFATCAMKIDSKALD